MERHYTEKDIDCNFELIIQAFSNLKKLGYYTESFDSGITRKEIVDRINSDYGFDQKFVFYIHHPDMFGIFQLQWRGDPMEIIRVLHRIGMYAVWKGKDNNHIKACLNKYLYDSTLKYEYDIYDSQFEARKRSKGVFKAFLTTTINKKSQMTCYDYLMNDGYFHNISKRINDELKLHTFTMAYFVKYQGGQDQLVRNLQHFNRNIKIQEILE